MGNHIKPNQNPKSLVETTQQETDQILEAYRSFRPKKYFEGMEVDLKPIEDKFVKYLKECGIRL